MVKVLTRPMFKKGGKVAAKNSGIISGFADGGNVRQGFQNGDLVNSDTLALIQQYMPEPERQRGLTRSDYLRIAAAGANIMGAQPTGRSGFIGALQAASPALSDLGTGLATDMATRDAAYDKKMSDYNKMLASAAVADQTSDLEYQRKLNIVGVEQENAMALLKEKLSVPQFEKQFVNEEAAKIRSQMKNLDKNSIEYQELKSELENNLYGSITKAVIDGKIDLLADEDFLYSIEDTVEAIEESGAQSDPNSEYYNMSSASIKTKVITDAFVAYGLTSVFVPEGKAEGGRVGLANGGGPYEPGSGPDPDPGSPPIMTAARGPYEPGSGPDPDPGSPPIMQTQASGISFEELRARLPKEVTDVVVRLLATSENALLDFANIQTQEDIAQFNQKYNTNLQLPTQVA